ncbi:MAG: heme exporter protein CcmB [Bacteroidota bacterium]|jgi:heme exporter protein B|nr:heme exporter protein CcmB [Bacteroidota bacterium]
MLLKEISILVKKEIILEWRQRYALNGMLLYVVSTIMVVYMGFNLRGSTLQPVTWNALFWIIMLFTAVNAIAKSFNQERQGRFIYYYTLVSPQGIILSKILYNAILMIFLTGLGIIFYSMILGNPVNDQSLFISGLLLGAVGFSTTMTLVSGIAAKAGNNATLMAILSFPVIIPMILMVIRISGNAIDGLDREASLDEILTLLAINAIVGSVSYLLFPYLWRS